MTDWSRDEVSTLQGVGPKLQEKLARLGIKTKQQMLFHLPLRYEDRTRITPVGSLQPGQRALIEVEVLQSAISYRRQGRSRRVLIVKVADGSGIMTLRFFHFSNAQQSNLEKGNWVRCFGEARWVMNALEMIHPEYERIDPANPQPLNSTLTPVYPAVDGLGQNLMRRLMQQLMRELDNKGLSETLPVDWLGQHDLPGVQQALSVLHHPVSDDDVRLIQAKHHPAQVRFIIEELAAHRISLLRRRQQVMSQPSPAITAHDSLQQKFLGLLPFQLTAAQQRVTNELLSDLSHAQPMMRLVQGDVGSGKTVVAALACIPVIASGFQCALMAPTEILAQQHFRNFESWMSGLGIEVLCLTGADKGKRRQHKERMIADGSAAMIIGTHALFQQSVSFRQLGLIIVDEQHRFGVEQRLALQKKAPQGLMPHQLIMTATPIPRTLAMSIYADLDYSQIDELPPGRTPVHTTIIAESRRSELIERVRAACQSGQQVYWICTLIEESDALQCEAAEITHRALVEQLDQIEVGLVHGRMKAVEKDAEIARFKNAEVQVLVATTVVEVGVDVPNASIMIIENPERLGLSQIHQLRGRVGRGNQQSYCLLLVKNGLSRQATQRLEVIRNHQDGFLIAEKDLEQRGAGEVLGTRQTGEAGFRMADLLRDQRWFGQATELADVLMQDRYASARRRLIANWVGERQSYSNVG